MSLIIDITLIWLDFHNFMTLNKMTCTMEVLLLCLTTLMALSHLQRVIISDFDWLSISVYLIHFFLINPVCFLNTAKKLGAHIQKQEEIKDEKKAKNIKGRLKLKVEKKIKKEMPNIVL